MPVQQFLATMTSDIATGDTILRLHPLTNGNPLPTPVPTPAPTQPPFIPQGGVTELPLGAQNASLFKSLNQGEVYAMRLPLPFTSDLTFNVGQGQGTAPTFIKLSISDIAGAGLDRSPPDGETGDPNSGVAISASLNPTKDRAGNYQKAKVTQDRQWWVNFVCPNGPGSISHNWN